MFDPFKWPNTATWGLGAVALGAAIFTAVQPAAAADSAAADLRLDAANRVVTVSPTAAAYHGGFGDGPGSGDHEEALADALGITVEELEAAYEEAWNAVLAQAVEDGALTEEQADELQSRGLALGHRGWFGRSGDANVDALLADALGISVDELNAARIEARGTLLEQAVADGDLTEEEANLLMAREATRPYVEEAMAAAYTSAIEQAMEDGAITQEQADLLLEESANPGARSFFGGRGGHRGGPGGRFMLPRSGEGIDSMRGGFFDGAAGSGA